MGIHLNRTTIEEVQSSNNTVSIKNNAGTFVEIVIGASRIFGRKETGEIVALTPAQVAAIMGYSTNNSILIKNNSGTIVETVVAPSRIFGRKATGEMVALTGAEASTIIGLNLPLNYISGLITSNNGADAAKDIDIAAGVCRSLDNTEDISVAALTKQIDATWSVGDAAGGAFVGTTVGADALYALWAILRTDTGVTDVGFDDSFASPTLPTNYDKKRLIAAVATNSSSNIVSYIQSGNIFRYQDNILEVNDGVMVSQVYKTATILVPPSCMSYLYCNATNATANLINAINVKTKGANEGLGISTGMPGITQTASANIGEITGKNSVMVDSASQIEYAVFETSGGTTAIIKNVAFDMITRRDP